MTTQLRTRQPEGAPVSRDTFWDQIDQHRQPWPQPGGWGGGFGGGGGDFGGEDFRTGGGF